jgi:6-phosphofructokinase 1
VEFAIAGRNAVMPAIRRISDSPYRWDIIEAPLSAVANQEKLLPPEFISADGFGITDAARRYLAPLIVGEAFPPFKNGLPEYVRLQNVATPKKLTRQCHMKSGQSPLFDPRKLVSDQGLALSWEEQADAPS